MSARRVVNIWQSPVQCWAGRAYTGEDIGDTGQGWLNTGDTGAVEQLERHPGFFQYGDVLGGAIELGLGAEQLVVLRLRPS